MAPTNTLGVYSPVFYAQEALIQLEKALGMAGRVYRGYDEERRAFRQGETINIRRPSTFTAEDAPSSAQNLVTQTVALTLSYWREVKFSLTDKELSFTQERIISDHIRPAAYTLADDVDQKLSALYKDVPWYYDLSADASIAITDVTGPRAVLFNNKVPLNDGNVHYMVDGTIEAGLLSLAAFSTGAGAGSAQEQTQLRGTLGTKFGVEIFANQNVQTHTGGVITDKVGAMNATAAVGATTLVLKSLGEDAEAVAAGDTLIITGNAQRYAITAVATVASNAMTVTITPPLVAEAAEDAVVTIDNDTHKANLMFHRNAFALAMAPLSEMGNELGARIATITDPVTGLSIRSRLYYVGNSSEVHVALDILYGVKTLDPNLAVRARGA